MKFFKSSEHGRRRPPLPVLVVLGVVIFALGVLLGHKPPSTQSKYGEVTGINSEVPGYLSKNVDFSLFWQVWKYVHDNAYDRPVKDTQLFYGSLAGVVAGLQDPYSVFMDPEMAKSFSDELEGTFDGIGAEIGIRNQQLVIIAPLPGTPAERGGLKASDAILGIDKRDTTGMSVDQAVSLIRGKAGTPVTLTILSNGDKESRSVTITRERITIQVVKGELKDLPGGKGKAAYIKVVHFSQDVDQRLREVWQNLSAKGPTGIILDLRNNPGGFLDQAVAIASHWVKQGVIVREQFAAPTQPNDYGSVGPANLKDIRTVILVNQGSASASEIVTGALQDYGLATVVGEQTFGKGSVQDLQDFPDGSAVKLTIAKWFTPKGRSIDNDGLQPDIVVKQSQADTEAGRDLQLDRALELLAK